MSDHQIFELGDIDVQSGLRIRNARLAYKTYGELNAARDNVIVFPTFFSAKGRERNKMQFYAASSGAR